VTKGGRPSRRAGEQAEWAGLLRRCPLFEGITSKDLDAVLESASLRAAPRAGFFFLEGDSPNRVYVLIQGKIRLVRSGPQGREVILGFIEPGEPFGYVAVWAGTAHAVSAQAAQASRALAWEAATVARYVAKDPGLAIRGLRLMARHVEGSWDRVQDISTGRVEWRIARALLRLARFQERTVDAGTALTLDVREQDLAELVGSTAYTVSRILSAWKRAGIVDVRRERIILRRPQQLLDVKQDGAK
jgi:CRP/FNR family transcriptional regulator, nitrogen oxide reductase regulator